MEQNLILESNELIAKFIQIHYHPWIEKDGTILGLVQTDAEGNIDWDEGLDWYQPDRDWKQLMYVINKIHSHPDCPSGIIIDDYRHRAYHEKGDKIFEAQTTLEATYNCVVWSIKWLNNHDNRGNPYWK